MSLAEITPLILTYNEQENIGRCLHHLSWAPRVVVIDSGSDDRTLAICEQFTNVEVVYRRFDNHTAQWNYGLDQIKTKWVLALDADYMIGDDMAGELRMIPTDEPGKVWYAKFHHLVFGQRLRGTLYPPRAVLYEPKCNRYMQDGHTQLLSRAKKEGFLQARIYHDDRKTLLRWLDSQRRYAALEADKLNGQTELIGIPDRIRKLIWPAVPATFLYTLFVKGVVLDGWPGLYYSLQRTYAELLLSLELINHKMARRSSWDGTGK